MLSSLAVFTTAQGWIELGTLIFLEMVLGIDNLVFIAITTDRLPENKQHVGRRFGLTAALCMRIMLLCMISWLASLQVEIFNIDIISSLSEQAASVTARDLIMLAGGIYLVYKGITELIAKIKLEDEDISMDGTQVERKSIRLVHAIALIAIMDIVFSLDSVITAVGMVNELPIMISAVIIAVMIMIIFADAISNFINRHSGVKILALSFIAIIGLVLVGEGFNSHFDKTTIYFAMGFALVVQIIEIKWKTKGALISSFGLFAITMAISIIPNSPIPWYMPISGVIISAIIIALYALYENRLAKAKAAFDEIQSQQGE